MGRRTEGSHWYLGHLDGEAIPPQRDHARIAEDREATRQLGSEMNALIRRTAARHKWTMHDATLRLNNGAGA